MFRRLWSWIKRIFREPVSTPPLPRPAVGEFTPEKYKEYYRNLWETMEIDPKRESTIKWYMKEGMKHKERYESVSELSGVPWQVIAAIHALESGYSFEGVLHNGDRIIGTGRKTYRVPKGRGPFNTWEEAAIDALAIKKQPKEWNIENTLYYLERFNGLGYLRDPNKPDSPYLWSFSNHYVRGKYTHDGRYSSTAVSKQCGAAVIIRELGF